MRYFICLLLFLITACANTAKLEYHSPINIPSVTSLIDDSLFGEPIPVATPEEIYNLTEPQKKEFLAFYNSPEQASIYPNRRLAKYLKDKLSTFGFYADTMTAMQGMQNEQGNCLSLAILTKSLADIVGVDAGFHLVATPPVFHKEGDIILSSQHVKTLLYDPKRDNKDGFFVLIRGRITIDYFPVDGSTTLRVVESDEFDAMYYQNKAAEALIKGEKTQAFWFAKGALASHKNDSHAINVVAILYEGLGNMKKAEELFLFGIKYSDHKFELLKNYHSLLVEQNRLVQADIIAKELVKYDQPDPFKWVTLGDEKYQLGDYSSAIVYFRKAIKIADYLHEPYFGIARAELSRGNIVRARRAMKKARDNAIKVATISIYQSKYDHLTKMIYASSKDD